VTQSKDEGISSKWVLIRPLKLSDGLADLRAGASGGAAGRFCIFVKALREGWGETEEEASQCGEPKLVAADDGQSDEKANR
jgi:hypothetical protein